MAETKHCAIIADMTDAATGPLDGVRIADLTTVVMGPMATRVLGDLGADVIKIEAPDHDFMRDFEPKRSAGMSGFTLNLNRNKRSVQIDLKTDDGHRAMLDLVATCDAFVTNMRPSALERLGLSPDDLLAVKADLVYCSAVGFGADGPYAGRAAYDDAIQALSGLASMQAWAGGDPAYMPTVIADKVAGLHIVYAVIASLFRRAMSGEGDVIEVPMAELMGSFNLVEHLNGHTFEPKEEPFSYARLRTRNRRPRRSKDGWICLLPYSGRNYRDFFEAVGHPEHSDDPRFRTVNDRIDNVDELYALVDRYAELKTTDDWMTICEELSIPCMPVLELDALEQNEHYEAVGLFTVDEHPTEGAYRVVKDPIDFSNGVGGVRHHAPRVGQHTAEVMRELGWSDAEIEDLQ